MIRIHDNAIIPIKALWPRQLTLTLLALLATISLTGCFDESSPNPGEESESGGIGGGVVTVEWGDLKCQKTLTCQNPVLNIDKEALTFFIATQFPQEELSHVEPDWAAFQCGQRFLEEWSNHFGLDSDIEPEKFMKITSLGQQVLDISSCQAKENLDQQLNQYFKNHKEN